MSLIRKLDPNNGEIKMNSPISSFKKRFLHLCHYLVRQFKMWLPKKNSAAVTYTFVLIQCLIPEKIQKK